MRKNSKDYFINSIRDNAGKGIEFVSKLDDPKGIQKMAYDECHNLLKYFGLCGGKKYNLKYLKEQSEYSNVVMNVALTGKNQEGFIC